MAAAAFGGRVNLSSLLAEFVDPSLPGPQRRLYRYQTYAEGRVMACREHCSLWQVYLHVCVMVIPKIEFSLCVVFFLYYNKERVNVRPYVPGRTV
jgi:hypothetical protein